MRNVENVKLHKKRSLLCLKTPATNFALQPRCEFTSYEVHRHFLIASAFLRSVLQDLSKINICIQIRLLLKDQNLKLFSWQNSIAMTWYFGHSCNWIFYT
jgi:hypothetical protein